MSSYKRTLSDDGAIANVIDFNDDGELVSRDVMSGERVEAVLDQNHIDREHASHNKDANGRTVARIPMPMWAEWRKKWKAHFSDRWTWQTYLAMKLSDPDYAKLRTHVGGLDMGMLSEVNKTGSTLAKPKPAIIAP